MDDEKVVSPPVSRTDVVPFKTHITPPIIARPQSSTPRLLRFLKALALAGRREALFASVRCGNEVVHRVTTSFAHANSVSAFVDDSLPRDPVAVTHWDVHNRPLVVLPEC